MKYRELDINKNIREAFIVECLIRRVIESWYDDNYHKEVKLEFKNIKDFGENMIDGWCGDQDYWGGNMLDFFDDEYNIALVNELIDERLEELKINIDTIK